MKPNSRLSTDLIIGKDKEWRDKIHYKTALAFAIADWMVIFPLLIIGNTVYYPEKLGILNMVVP